MQPEIAAFQPSSLFLIVLKKHYIPFINSVCIPIKNPNLILVLYLLMYKYLFIRMLNIRLIFLSDLIIFFELITSKIAFKHNLARNAFEKASTEPFNILWMHECSC